MSGWAWLALWPVASLVFAVAYSAVRTYEKARDAR